MAFGKSAADCFNQATHFIGAQKLTEARDWLKEGLRLDPNQKEAWMDLGCVLMETREYGESERALRKALSLDSHYGGAHFNLGSLYMRHLGKHQEALGFYNAAIRCDPEDEDAVCFAAEALQRLGRNREAGDLLNKALKAHPGFRKAAQMRDAMAGAFRQWLDKIADG